MGYACSWIAVFGHDKADVLRVASLRDTGEPDDVREAPLSGATLPGWFVLFANDFGYVTPKRVARLSWGGRAIACQIHEGAMVTTACEYVDCVMSWIVAHDGSSDIGGLEVIGTPPPELDAIRAAQEARQAAAGDSVDHISDIPLDLARSICGFRHDLSSSFAFTRLKKAGLFFGAR